MLKKTKRLILYLLLVLAIPTQAQERTMAHYASKKLWDMAECVYQRYQTDCQRKRLFTLQGFPVYTALDDTQRVSHIGFALFDEKLTVSHPSPIFRFVERYLLDLFLQEDNAAIAQRLHEDKVTVHSIRMTSNANLHQALSRLAERLRNTASLKLSQDEQQYTVHFQDREGNLLDKMQFPIDYQLLSGMDKIECEKRFCETLRTNVPAAIRSLPSRNPEQTERIGANLYMERGEYYQIEAMNNNRYYTLQKRQMQQACSTECPDESIQNLFTMQADPRIKAELTLRLYGGKKWVLYLPLEHLLAFCQQSGCTTFAGIEKSGDEQVQGTAILLNRTAGYSHTLAFEAPIRLLTTPDACPIKLEMYLFSPIHNIQTLFYEQQTKTNTL